MGWRNPYLADDEEQQRPGSSLLLLESPPLATDARGAAVGLSLLPLARNSTQAQAVQTTPSGGGQGYAPRRRAQPLPEPQDAPWLAPGPLPALAGGGAPSAQAGPPATLPNGQPNPLYGYVETLRANGMLPPPRQIYQPTEKDQRDARLEGVYAGVNNLAQALGATTGQYQDPVAAQDAIRARQQALLDQQFKVDAENAQALREAVPEDFAGYLTELATDPNFKGGSMTDYLRRRKEAEREPNEYRQIIEAEGLVWGSAAAQERIKQLNDAKIKSGDTPYFTGTITTGGGVTYNARTGKYLHQDGTELSPAEVAGLRQPQYDPTTRGDIAGAQAREKSAEELAAENYKVLVNAPTEYQSLVSPLSTLQSWVDRFEAGTAPDTGPLVALANSMFGLGSEDLGALNSDSIAAATKVAKQSGLAPMSNADIESIIRSVASIAKGEEFNTGSLKATIARGLSQAQIMRDDTNFRLTRLQKDDKDRYEWLMQNSPYYRAATVKMPEGFDREDWYMLTPEEQMKLGGG